MSETSAIQAIYDAAFSRSGWPDALETVLLATQASSIHLYGGSQSYGVRYYPKAANASFPADLAKAYLALISGDAHSGLDATGAARIHQYPKNTVIKDDEIFVLDEAYWARPENQFAVQKAGVARRFFVNLSDDPNSYLGVMILYPAQLDALPDADLLLMSRLAPHLAQALAMHGAVRDLLQRHRAVLGILDEIDLAICIVEPDGQVRLSNRRAAELFDERDGLWLTQGNRLAANDAGSLDALEDALRSVAQLDAPQSADGSRGLEIRRPRAATLLYAIVSPLSSAGTELESGQPGALLTLIDDSRPAEPQIALMKNAYGLTPAETRVAKHLVQGLSNPEVARALDVKVDTVKTQVAAILQKTGCQNRLEFVWRVFRFSTPLI